MRRSENCVVLCASVIGVCALSFDARGTVLLHDDFTGGSINPALWSIETPFSGSNVSVNANRAQFNKRGYLNTVAEFDPITQPIQISGRWEFGDHDDFMQIATRSEGFPNGGTNENRNALELVTGASRDDVRIQTFLNGANAQLIVLPISIEVGDIFDFTIIDDGSSFSFTLSEVGGEGEFLSHTIATSLNTGHNHVTFHNRELNQNVSYLHEVTIEAIPTPGGVSVGLGMLGAGAVRRRRGG
ncbi:MAG: hypothetical protein ACF8GE_07060 [Phycisphaerales bacterium JB043]